MSRALSESLGWFRRQALSYLLILAVLLVGSWLFNEYRRMNALSAELQAAQAAVRQGEAETARARAAVALADRVLAARLAGVQRARDLVQQELLAKTAERDAHRARYWPWAGLHGV